MDVRIEKIISKDTGISVDHIRESSWEELEESKYQGRPFRPHFLSVIGESISLFPIRKMPLRRISVREKMRMIKHRIRHMF